MFEVDGFTIKLSRGDTGAIKVNTQTDYDFTQDDRALFSVKNSIGEVVREQAYSFGSDKSFTINFANADTDSLAAGSYSWDIRYIINPYYDAQGKIIDGDQVITPKLPMEMQLLQVVGEV